MRIARRLFLLGFTSLAAGCTINAGGGVIAGTLDVARIDAYAQAIENVGVTLLAVPAIAAGLGAQLAPAQGLVAAVVAAIGAFDAASGGSVTVSFSVLAAKAAAQSVLAAGRELLALLQPAAGHLVKAQGVAVSDGIASLQTVLALLQVLLAAASGTVGASAPATPMTEAEALRVAGVRLR